MTLIKQLNNLKPQLKVPFFHRGLIKYDEWNKENYLIYNLLLTLG